MSDAEDEFVPDVATAQKLVKEFEGISNTDVAFAQCCLQENNWDLHKALDKFFAAKTEKRRRDLDDSDSVLAEYSQPKKASIESALSSGLLTTQPPDSLTVLSWNIDGISEKNLKIRTKGVCKIIEAEQADIVFLQEVIPETFSYIQSKLSGYECIAGSQGDYFVATLLRWGRVYKDTARHHMFPGTCMGRHLQHVQAHCGKVKFDLLNTHLESSKEHAEERKAQLKICLEKIKSSGDDLNVLYGGDLNMRDKELLEVGGLPPRTVDSWEACGSRKEVQYTWDMNRNTNIEFPGKFKPRCRFDRLYLRPSRTAAAAMIHHFGLVGLKKIQGTQSFPSDHWGMLIKLKLDQTPH